MIKMLSMTAFILIACTTVAFGSPQATHFRPDQNSFVSPHLIYKQTIEYVYTLAASEEESSDLPLISAIITTFDHYGNITAIELKDRDTMTTVERLLEDLARNIVLDNWEKEIVSIRYELNMVGDPVSADIMYFDMVDLDR